MMTLISLRRAVAALVWFRRQAPLATRATPRSWVQPFLRAAALAAVLAVGMPAHAQAQAGPPQQEAAAAENPVVAEDLHHLIDTLENPDRRERLVGQLKMLVAAERHQEHQDEGLGVDLLNAVSTRLEAFSDQMVAAAEALADLPNLLRGLRSLAADDALRAQWAEVVGKLVAMLVGGLACEKVVHLALGAPRRRVRRQAGQSAVLRAPLAAAHAVLDLVPLMVFAGVAYATLPLLQIYGGVRFAALWILMAHIVARLIQICAATVLMPRAGAARLAPVDDETATYLYLWIRRLSVAGVYGAFAVEAARLLGLPATGHLVLLKLLGLALTAMVVIFLLQNRAAVARWIRGAEAQGPLAQRLQGARDRVAEIWHVLAALYVVAIFAVWSLQVKGGFEYMMRASVLTVVVIVAAGLLNGALTRLVDHAFAVSADLKTQFPHLEGRANRYLPLLKVALRWAIAVAAALAVLQSWGADTMGWLATELGRRMMASLGSILMVTVIALALWEAVNAWVERYLGETDGQGSLVQRSARARTLLPLLRHAILAVLVVTVGLIVLSEVGVNIAPLLAGAGVVGLAVGVGSQKLVQDLITGLFMLFEDTIAVGDAVKLGEHAGTVEALSIRTIRLRDLSGNVHTLPFSAITTVVNMSRDFSFYLLDVGVSYREDVDHVMAVLKDLGQALRDDPEFGPFMTDAIEVMGVDKFLDSAVTIRMRLKTQVGKNWYVGREFNRRLKHRFDAEGIEMPFPHSTVYFGEDRAGQAAPIRVRNEPAPALAAAGLQPAMRVVQGDKVDFPMGNDPMIGA